MRRHADGFTVRALVTLAAIALVLALVAGYTRHVLVDSDQFANRATTALRDDNVSALIAERVTDQLVLRNRPDLITARPLISSVVSSAVGGRAFTGVFRSGVNDVHRALFNADQNTLTLTVADVGTIAAAALDVLRPSVADEVRKSNSVDLVTRDIGTVSGDLVRAAESVRILAGVLMVLTLLLAGTALRMSDDRRRTVSDFGVAVASSGVLLLIALAAFKTVLLNGIERPEARAAAGAIWNAFAGDLRTAAWIGAGAGAVVAAAATASPHPVDISRPLRRLASWVTDQPESGRRRALRGGILVLVGVALLVDRQTVLDLVVTVTGLYLVYAGLATLLTLLPAPVPLLEGKRRPDRRPLIAAVAACALIVAVAVTFVGSGAVSSAAPKPGPCLGDDSLCDRAFDRVALPATHNSMSAPVPGFFSSQQDAPIPAQLRDGIRGLLIDTHYADRLSNGKLRTELDERKLRPDALTDGVSQDAVDAALRLRERLGFRGTGTRGMYLCHSFCELGGIPLSDALDALYDFLVANPSQVVTVINQDYITPEDFVAAVRDAGLEKFAYRGPTGRGQWPTVREMIDSNQRVVFLAENKAGGAPWYHLAYAKITQETPFSFRNPSQLTDPAKLPASCRDNRGPKDAPLFLVNHWITTDPVPKPSNAAKVNALEPLLRRLEECQKLRGQIPNLVAVDFYRRGDLFGAVRALNQAG